MVIDTQTGENYTSTDGLMFNFITNSTHIEELLRENEHAVAVLGRKRDVDLVASLIKEKATHPKGAFS